MNEQQDHLLSHIADYLPTISENSFSWNRSENWNEEEKIYFTKTRQHETRQIFSTYNQSSSHGATALKVLANWILNDSDQKPIAWAECQALFGSFTIVFLFIGSDKKSAEIPEEAIAHLITAISLATEADEIRIISKLGLPVSLSEASTETSNKAKDNKKIYSPNSLELYRKENFLLNPIGEVIVSTHDWQNSSLGSKSLKKLTYLKKRKARLDEKFDCGCDLPTKRGFFSKIFRPKV